MNQYWSVRVGRLDAFNGPNEWAYPNEKSATLAATNEHKRHPNRVVVIKRPDGTVKKRFGKKPKSLKRLKQSA